MSGATLSLSLIWGVAALTCMAHVLECSLQDLCASVWWLVAETPEGSPTNRCARSRGGPIIAALGDAHRHCISQHRRETGAGDLFRASREKSADEAERQPCGYTLCSTHPYPPTALDCTHNREGEGWSGLLFLLPDFCSGRGKKHFSASVKWGHT